MEQPHFYRNAFGDRYLDAVNRGVFNHLGAASAFRRHFAEGFLKEDTLYIVVGTDSGLLPRYLLDQGVPTGARYLFLELDTLLSTIEEALADLDLGDAITIRGQEGLQSSLRDIRFSDYAAGGAIRLIESIGAQDAFIPDYRVAVAAIRQELDALLWAFGCQLSNPSFVRAQLHNLPELQQAGIVLQDSLPGTTAALLGGGPSLDAILPWVKANRDRLVVIAVSRIARRLLEVGLTPHILVSIDPTGWSFDISKEALQLDHQVILAHANHVAPALLAQWRGPSVYLDRRYPWRTALNQANLSSAGPTVTNTGFALAQALGCSRIVLGGIDLCHSREGFSHARGSNEFEAGPKLGLGTLRVDTNDGGVAETTPDFYNAIRSFADQAGNTRAAGIQVINPAPGAARIEGVDHVALDQIQLADAGPLAAEVLAQRLGGFEHKQRIENLREMQRELARAHGHLRQIAKLAEDALACNDGLFGRNGKVADFRYKKRMDKIERVLDRRLRDLSEVVRMFSSRAFLHMPPSDREWSDEEVEAAGRTYYTAYLEQSKAVLGLVEDAQHRVDTALEEESDEPDMARLFRQWSEDQVPGRAAAWLFRHPGSAARLGAEEKARFDGLAREFEAVLGRRDTDHAHKARAETALGPVRAKLLLLLRESNRDELSNLVEQLRRHDDPTAAQLLTLGLGCLAELDQEPEMAFTHYANLVEQVRETLNDGAPETPNPQLEDALRRMVLIAMSLEWKTEALLVLGTLSGLSPAYAPQYAELLRLSGDPQGALDVYHDYLRSAPEDTVVLLRLGRIYQTIGAADAARTAFAYVLEKEPDNRAARTLLEQLGSAA